MMPNQDQQISREPTHFAYIDAVRGMAFLGVISYHAAKSIGHFPSHDLLCQGLYGVQLFFLASAITLCYSMSARHNNDRFPILYFYLRRLFRIAPLFWIAIIFYWTVPGIKPPSWYSQFASYVVHPIYFILTAAFLHGWHPYTLHSIVPGGWSIAVEMNFYILFPFLYRFLGHSARRAALAVAFCPIYFSIVGHLELFLRHGVFSGIPSVPWVSFTYYWLPEQLPVFLIGFLAYHLIRHSSIQAIVKKRFWAAWIFLFSGLVMFSVFFGSNSRLLPNNFWVSMALAGLIIALSGNSLTWLINPIIRYIGTISYSCYLVHFAALDIACRLLGIYLTPSMHMVDTGHSIGNLYLFLKIMAIALPLTILMATITRHLIEEPGIKLGKKLILRISALKSL